MNVEPGAYWPCVARLLSGEPCAGSCSAAKSVSVIPPMNFAGSYVGFDASASTEPSCGSSTVDFPGVEGVRLTQRAYPQGNLAAHLLGYVAEINDKELAARKNKGYKAGDEIGKSGIEAAYEDDLRGSPGIEQLEVDARGRVLRTIASKPPVTGNDVKLTVDIDIQKLAEDSLDRGLKAARVANDRERLKHFLAPAGAVVVLDPHDGSVLALASNPTYDPAKFIGGITLTDFAASTRPARRSS